MVEVGEKAPEFELESTKGRIRLSKLLSSGRVLIAFYTEDATPSCSTEIATLVDVYEPVRALGGEIVAVSADDMVSHREFAERLDVEFPLASDTEMVAAQIYDVVSEEDAKRSRRALFVIEQDGTVAYIADPFSPNSLSQIEGALKAMGLEL